MRWRQRNPTAEEPGYAGGNVRNYGDRDQRDPIDIAQRGREFHSPIAHASMKRKVEERPFMAALRAIMNCPLGRGLKRRKSQTLTLSAA